jgi:feruloyl esterase
MGGESETKDFLHLFMVPDMGMCPGENPDVFDALGAIERWREQAIAPDRIIASYSDRNGIYKTRPVCAYPEVAIYRGNGSTSDAENFICGIPEW